MDHHHHSEDEQIPAKSKYPPGYRFVPTDRELIQEYLQKKINKEPILTEIDEVILKHINPMELPEKYPKLGDNDWYFFTPRDRKYPNGERPDRGSDTGYWKATGADKLVQVGEETIGYRKALVFYEGKPQKGVKTNWMMHEFRVKEETERKKETPKTMRLDDWVLCRMYEKAARLTNNSRNNSNNKNNNRSEREVDESQSSGGESSQNAEAGEISQTAAAVTITNHNPNPNQDEVMVNLPMVISENPNPYNYYYSEPNIGELSLEDLVNPVDAFGNPFLNEFGFHQQPYASTSSSLTNNGFQASSSWTNNIEAGFPSYSVPLPPNNTTNFPPFYGETYSVPLPPNNTTNFPPFYGETDTQQEQEEQDRKRQDRKRFRYY